MGRVTDGPDIRRCSRTRRSSSGPSVEVLLELPLRQATGMVASFLELAGRDWLVPDHSTLCRRRRTSAVQVPHRRMDGPLRLLVDSTGIEFLGDGEWR